MPSIRADDATAPSYLAADVINACEITGPQLTSYLSKSKFILPSSTAGQGRARKFARFDVYMIGLMARLTDLTRNQNWSARSLEYLAYIGPEAYRKTYPIVDMTEFCSENLDKKRLEIIQNSSVVHPLFVERDWMQASWIVFAESWHVDKNLFGLRVLKSDSAASNFKTIESGYAFNVTWYLWCIDNFLMGKKQSDAPDA